jgi:hypothetical protein
VVQRTFYVPIGLAKPTLYQSFPVALVRSLSSERLVDQKCPAQLHGAGYVPGWRC